MISINWLLLNRSPKNYHVSDLGFLRFFSRIKRFHINSNPNPNPNHNPEAIHNPNQITLALTLTLAQNNRIRVYRACQVTKTVFCP